MSNHPLVLLHLADIHFRANVSGSIYDRDADVRNELDRDCGGMVVKLGSFHGILISGDTAFSGKADEYEIALRWLEALCLKLKCPTENVWTVPGNHDVDRSVIEGSALLQTLHQQLRPNSLEEIDPLLQKFMQDREASDLLYRPIFNYNEFAAKFRCKTDATRLFWEHDFKLNDGSTLRLRGINSTIVSDHYDDDAVYKLIVGTIQATPTRQDGVEYVIMCHHPPSWLRDQDAIVDIWNARARIQFFGHKHRQRVNQVDNTLIVSSGATHPDRREPNWLPTYNILKIWVDRDGSNRLLNIQVYPRIWNDVTKQFQAEYNSTGSEFRQFTLSIDPWELPAPLNNLEEGSTVSTSVEDIPNTIVIPPNEVVPKWGYVMDPARRLTYRFLTLPFHVKMRIAQKLNLIEDEDSGVQDSELFRRFFQRAKQKTLLEQLWHEVETAHSAAVVENPFTGQ